MRNLMMGLICVVALAACGDNNGGSDVITEPGGGGGGTFKILPGPKATDQMLTAIVNARPGDVIEFGCGYFDLTSGIQLIGTENITIKGCGRDKTVLSFRNSGNLEGILATNVRGLTVQDLTVLDTQANGIELRGVRFATLRNVRTMWSSGRKTENEDTITADNFSDKLNVACTTPSRSANETSPDYQVSIASGRYGIYPVSSFDVLVDNAESIGASDAGIYIGQTIGGIIKNSRAAFNVFGFEIENVQGSEYVDNIAECNTGGFLVYDLDGLKHHGKRARVHRNISRNNNTYNFAEPGTIVANVPPGSGFITLAYDKIDIFDNEFSNNDTAGIILTSYRMLGMPGDRRMDVYSEGVHIWNNRFANNGNNLPPPNFQAIIETQGEQYTSVFPLVVGLKVAAGHLANPANLLNDPLNYYRGGHIIWDGYIDDEIAQHPDGGDCPYPVDENGQPIPADEDGKPESGNRFPNPDCTYNAYKFDEATGDPELNNRIVPKWWFACIDAGTNDFDADSLTYANFKGTNGLDSAISLIEGDVAGIITNLAGTAEFAADFNIEDHYCAERFGRTLTPLAPVVLDTYTPRPAGGSNLSPQQVAALCNATVAAGEINREALTVNCPTLDAYKLFADPADPRSAPRGGGVPFVLNSKLFSDYATKYRVAYLPPGQPAQYRDIEGADGVNATYVFPVGTVIAKTFAFTDEVAGTERVVETRLLIKRQHEDGEVFWDGLPYIWGNDGVARLALEGGSTPASWDYTDPQSGLRHTGSTEQYQIPHQNQCVSCHFNLDLDVGAAPIGPKPRNMNRAYSPESSWNSAQATHPVLGQNQIQYWCQNGLLTNCPDNLGVDPSTGIATALPRNPNYSIPGDAGFAAGSDADIEARARSYLEVNCQYCHNSEGFASNTGFFLDVKRPVDGTYGICKKPTASGSEGRGGRTYDIHPGNAANSILPFRIGPQATAPAAKMPPLARSVVDIEGHALIEQWVQNVITVDEERYPGSSTCQ